MSGQVFVFVHGFGGFADIWQGQIAFFKKTTRCIAIDLPGHGASPWAGQTLSDMAEELHRALLVHQVEKVVVIASSFGGLVALKCFERYPALAARFIFVGSLPRFISDENYPAGLNMEKICKLACQCQGDVGVVLDMFFRSLFTRRERENAHYPLIKKMRAKATLPSKDALLSMLDMLKTEDLRLVLRQVSVPVHFIFGDADHICPLALIKPLKAICPSATVDVVQDSGHFPFLSYPDVFNCLVSGYAGVSCV